MQLAPDLMRVKAEKGGAKGALWKMAEPLARLAEKPGEFYQFLEVWGKTVKIIDAMERENLSENEAVNAAQEALFDYSLVPSWVKTLRRSPVGLPFITFYYKAAPAVAKGGLRHPGKVAKYYALPYLLGEALVSTLNNVDDDDVKSLKAALPEFIRQAGHVFIWPYKDASGRWAFVDYGYLLPWKSWMQTLQDIVEMASLEWDEMKDAFSSLSSELGVLNAPLWQIGAAITTGVDSYTGREIYKDTDPPREQISKMMQYAWRIGAPTFLTDIGVAGHLERSIKGTPNYYGEPPLSIPQALARGIGINIYPTDPRASRVNNIERMKYEISQVKRAKTSRLKDPRLTSAERKELAQEYNEKLKIMRDDLSQYIRESKVHPNLYHQGGLVTKDHSKLAANLDKMRPEKREKHLRNLYHKNQGRFSQLLEYLESR